MQDSLKVEYTPTHREHNVSETTQASFLAKFKQPAINLARKDTATVFQRHYALCDIL